MPEGDTIYRSARTLGRALTGAAVVGASAPAPGLRTGAVDRLVGQTIGPVESRGKHLLIWFLPSDMALHTHMMMSGSWHLYRSGQAWRKPTRLSRVVLEVPGWTAVCFSAPVCELLTRDQLGSRLAGLGPDALEEEPDLADARRRLDARADWTIGEALLDQRVLAGVGNVYRCEVLFLHGVHPWTRVRDLPQATRGALITTAVELLKANAGPRPAPRTTTGRPGAVTKGRELAVYGRAHRPCPRCRAAVRVARLGTQARLTYWCPRCQPPTTGR